jgi:hypothetical protein
MAAAGARRHQQHTAHRCAGSPPAAAEAAVRALWRKLRPALRLSACAAGARLPAGAGPQGVVPAAASYVLAWLVCGTIPGRCWQIRHRPRDYGWEKVPSTMSG